MGARGEAPKTERGRTGREKKETGISSRLSYVFVTRIDESLSLRSAYRAGVSASAATYASVSVDNILAVTLGNCGNGASVCASAASDTFIGYLISHW